MSENYQKQTLAVMPQDVIVKRHGRNAYAQQYTTSLIVAGNRLEVKRYKYPMTKRYLSNSSRGTTKSLTIPEGETIYLRRKDNIKRASTRLRRLIHANIGTRKLRGKSTRFVTLTYADQERALPKNHAEHMQDIARFIRRINDRYGKQRYVYVTELTKKGAVHFHVLLFNMPYNNRNEIKELWGMGWIDIKKVGLGKKSVSKTADYIANYVGKDTDNADKFQKCYRVSEGLQQPLEIFDPEWVERLLTESFQKGYVKSMPRVYEMPFFNNELTLEIWEPNE